MKRFFPLRCHSVIFHLYQYFFWRVAATMRRFPWLRIQEDPLPTAKLLASQIVKLSTSRILATPWKADSVFINVHLFSRFFWRIMLKTHTNTPSVLLFVLFVLPQHGAVEHTRLACTKLDLAISNLDLTWSLLQWKSYDHCLFISNHFIFTKAQVWWAMLPLCWHVNARKQRIERCRFLLSMWLTAVRSIPKKEQKKMRTSVSSLKRFMCFMCFMCFVEVTTREIELVKSPFCVAHGSTFWKIAFRTLETK